MNLTTPLVLNANRHPHKMCVTCEGRSYSYQQFNEEVNKLANGLIALGLKHDEKVGLFMKNSDHFAIALYAIWKAGGVVVPINFHLVTPEVAYILEQSECKMLFCDANLEEITAKANKGHNGLEKIIVQNEAKLQGHLSWNQVFSANCAEPDVVVLNTDNAEILYTSGTTGRPKGALFDHQRIMNVNMNFLVMKKMSSDDVFLHLAPLFHSAQLNGFLTTAIYLGASNVIHRDFNPVKTLEEIEEHKISVFFGVPTMYNAMVHVQENHYDLSSVRVCGYGAAPMAPALVERAIALFGTDQFYNLCGLTEAGPGGIFLTPEAHKTKLGAGGKAMYLTNVRVVTDNMEDAKTGEVGEFVMKGETIMKEYYRKPEETQRTFSDGWLLTGDMAVIDDDGFITVVDRKKDMIISGGENVYSVEVEQVLNSHPEILEAATIGIPDEKWGEIVVGIIVSKDDRTLNEEDIKSFCSERLAAYKIPKRFLYTKVLPRNASGKILKYQLREEMK